MTTLIMMLLIISSVSFFFMKHPLSSGFNLMVQTILVSLMTGIMNINYWYSYIMFLIMVGGMLVLFMYMTSIASNEKFSYNNMTTTYILIISLISCSLMMLKLNYMEMLNKNNEVLNWTMSLSKFFTDKQMSMMILMIIYLFITLIAVVKITKIEYGPLRQKF
uniref:NADH dehydrogenase subunit 6 n=1 Tax=Cantonius szechuanensis TaxID=3045900 RepID=UPI00257E7B5A|nr:NADH dehydrogenase subunit 6 [Cantonius szechuanensis]WHE42531.1 NADH dehydrogenase subunit 6 [Cantonius szechuanensis]